MAPIEQPEQLLQERIKQILSGLENLKNTPHSAEESARLHKELFNIKQKLIRNPNPVLLKETAKEVDTIQEAFTRISKNQAAKISPPPSRDTSTPPSASGPPPKVEDFTRVIEERREAATLRASRLEKLKSARERGDNEAVAELERQLDIHPSKTSPLGEASSDLPSPPDETSSSYYEESTTTPDSYTTPSLDTSVETSAPPPEIPPPLPPSTTPSTPFAVSSPVRLNFQSPAQIRSLTSNTRQATGFAKSAFGKLSGQATQTASHLATDAATSGTKNLAKTGLKKAVGSLTKTALTRLGMNALPGIGTAAAVGSTALDIGKFLWRQKGLTKIVAASILAIQLLIAKLFAAFLSSWLGIAGAAVGFAVAGPVGALAGGVLGYQFQNWLSNLTGVPANQNVAMAKELTERATSGPPAIRTNPLTGHLETIRADGGYDKLSAASEAAANMAVTVPLFLTLGVAGFGSFFVAMHILVAFTVPNPVGTAAPGQVAPPTIPSGIPIPSGTQPPPSQTFPPIQCVYFNDNIIPWTTDNHDRVATALNQLITNQSSYVNKLCANNYQIQLFFDGLPDPYCGYNSGGNSIFFYRDDVDCIMQGAPLYYLIAHETGHTFSLRYDTVLQRFYAQGFGQPGGPEGYIDSYPFAQTPFEDFAETIGTYISKPSVINRYPLHRQFAETYIFN